MIGSVQGQVGWVSEQRDLVNPHDRGVGLDDLLISLPAEIIL